jgi:hypothetical protein
MRSARVHVVIAAALFLAACGSGDGTVSTTSGQQTMSPTTNPGAPTAPVVAQGYTRLVAQTVHNIMPGGDETHCQYAMAPVDQDMDIVDVTGSQSKFGHHAVAFSYTPPPGLTVGSEIKCVMGGTEFTTGSGTMPDSQSMGDLASQGGYLGGVSPAGKTAALPEGVAFRLTKGQGIELNVHYINTGETPVDGDTYMDLKLVPPDPNRKIAALFVNLNTGFSVPPQAQASSTVDCVAQSDLNIILQANHMHSWGYAAQTQVIRASGTVEMLRQDTTWTAEMANNPTYARWDANNPFVLQKGDTLRTTCTWRNTTASPLTFPTEMCIGSGFALATNSNPKAPSCVNGTWVPTGI